MIRFGILTVHFYRIGRYQFIVTEFCMSVIIDRNWLLCLYRDDINEWLNVLKNRLKLNINLKI